MSFYDISKKLLDLHADYQLPENEVQPYKDKIIAYHQRNIIGRFLYRTFSDRKILQRSLNFYLHPILISLKNLENQLQEIDKTLLIQYVNYVGQTELKRKEIINNSSINNENTVLDNIELDTVQDEDEEMLLQDIQFNKKNEILLQIIAQFRKNHQEIVSPLKLALATLETNYSNLKQQINAVPISSMTKLKNNIQKVSVNFYNYFDQAINATQRSIKKTLETFNHTLTLLYISAGYTVSEAQNNCDSYTTISQLTTDRQKLTNYLNLPETASDIDIKTSYKKVMRTTHPDKLGQKTTNVSQEQKTTDIPTETTNIAAEINSLMTSLGLKN